METGKGKTLVAIMLMRKYYEDFYKEKLYEKKKRSPKMFFLVCDSSLIEQQIAAIKKNTGLEVNSLQGKKNKKSKNDYEDFKSFMNKTDIFVAIPDVVYKLLSTGFLRIMDINLKYFKRMLNMVKTMISQKKVSKIMNHLILQTCTIKFIFQTSL